MSLPLYDRVRSADPYVRLYALIEIAELRSKAALSDEAVKILREVKASLESKPFDNALADPLSLDRVNDLLEKYDNHSL